MNTPRRFFIFQKNRIFLRFIAKKRVFLAQEGRVFGFSITTLTVLEITQQMYIFSESTQRGRSSGILILII